MMTILLGSLALIVAINIILFLLFYEIYEEGVALLKNLEFYYIEEYGGTYLRGILKLPNNEEHIILFSKTDKVWVLNSGVLIEYSAMLSLSCLPLHFLSRKLYKKLMEVYPRNNYHH